MQFEFDPEWYSIACDLTQPSVGAQSPAAAPFDLDPKRRLAAD